MATIRTTCQEQCERAKGTTSGNVLDEELVGMLRGSEGWAKGAFYLTDWDEIRNLSCRYCDGPMTIELSRDKR